MPKVTTVCSLKHCKRETVGYKVCQHHRDKISRMVAHYSLKKFFACIDEEMKRDVVRLLCSNCHHLHTSKQNGANRAEHMIT